jgi:hypothetical protein
MIAQQNAFGQSKPIYSYHNPVHKKRTHWAGVKKEWVFC